MTRREGNQVPSSRRGATALAAVLVALGLVATACGGSSNAQAEPTPTVRPSETTSATATPTPTPTPNVTPLSPFEDQPPVKAAREFFVLLAKAGAPSSQDLELMLASRRGCVRTAWHPRVVQGPANVAHEA